MPAIRHDDLLLRLVKEITYIRSALRRVTTNLPLYDIASENTPAQLTANQNDYPPGNYDVLRMSGSTGVSITGITGGVKGRSLKIYNDGNYIIYFLDQHTGSQAANRFNLNDTVVLFPKQMVSFYYDSTNSRWIFSYPFERIYGAPTSMMDLMTWQTYLATEVIAWYDVCWYGNNSCFQQALDKSSYRIQNGRY